MKRIAIVVGLASLMLAGGGGVAWYVWTRTPKYSLKQLGGAIDHHDRYEFEKYVDIDAILQGVISDTSDNALTAMLGGAVATQAKPKLLAMVEDGNLPASPQAQKVIESVRHLDMVPIVQDGRNAHFTVNITTEGGAPFGLTIHMTQVSDGYWRIDRVMNAKELHEAEQAEKLAKRRAEVQANNDKIDKVHVVAKLHTCVPGGWEAKNRFQLKIQNAGTETIQGFRGEIAIPILNYDKNISSADPIAAGASDNCTWEDNVNEFIPATVGVCKLGDTDEFEVKITAIGLSGGQMLERAELPTSL